VVPAASAAEGLRLGRELRPRAIILDVMMPAMDGWATLTALKSDPELSSVPVVLLTIIDDKGMGYALGASEYLTKPIDPERLSAAVKRFKDAASPSRAIAADCAPNLLPQAGGAGLISVS
jgi:CheY-like chemotaxis protein